MTALEYMLHLHRDCAFWDYAEGRPASNSTIRRLLENNAVRINWRRVSARDYMDFPVTSLVMDPNSSRRTTLV